MKNINIISDFVNNNKDKEKTKNLFFEDGVLYSYGYHYPLSIKIKSSDNVNFIYFINKSGYSMSTATHTNHLIRAITNLNNLKELIEAKKKGEYEHIYLMSTEALKNLKDNIIYTLRKTIKEANINDLSLMELSKEGI